MRIYLSGAVSDDPDFLAKFAKWENYLLKKYPDARVFNPAEHCHQMIEKKIIIVGDDKFKLWQDCMFHVLPQIEFCSHIFFIPEQDEYHSAGANIELMWADKKGLEVLS